MNRPVWLLLVTLAVGAIAGPIYVKYDEPTVCSTRCKVFNKFKYEEGTTYVFDYTVQTETAIESASEDKSILGIKATAQIEVLSKCDMVLRLSDVHLSPKRDARFSKYLEDRALRFSFQDGIIEELCPVSDEEDWSMNIKRGVLSTFQNSMSNLENDETVHETDVTGNCPAEYKLVNKGWYVTAIKKTKHLLGCNDRNGWRSAVHASPYRVPSNIQSLPLMKSEHECDQEIEKRGYLLSTICREHHVFRPFSNYNNGSVTKVVQKLKFNRQVKSISFRPTNIDRRTSMVFTHSQDRAAVDRKQNLVEQKLVELCRLSINDVRPEVPTLFADLVFLMRGLDASSLRDIYRKAERGDICPQSTKKTLQFYLDALPMTSTSSSVLLIKELLISKTVTGREAATWLTSLALIQSPTREMISEVKAILDIKELEDKSMLPITSLVNNYCSKNPGCGDDYEVSGIVSTLLRNLGYGCYVRDETLGRILLTLRALGNAGHSETAGNAISNCFNRQSNPIEVRVTALDAFRRLPCTSDRSEVMSLLRDTDEDSELRIGAYLALMKCPTESMIKEIKGILDGEEVNQVGSFIWSHMTNLMETSSPHKQAIRDIMEDQRLQKEFNMDKIKYSKNYEGSFMFERINTGAVAESNVIWSSKSFIPRSAMVNLTVDLFGNSVNLLEMGGRIEGLEYLLETYLGPFGYFGEKSSKTSIEKSRAKLDELRGSMYMRMFGNEMAFKHFKGIEEFKSNNFNFLEFLIKISKKHDYSFSQSMMFLDSSMIIPTASGLPLNLTVTGVSSLDLKAVGTVDLRKVAAKPRSLNIDGTVRPSGAITITGAMMVDAFVTKSGLKVTSTLHSSTSVNGRIKLERGKILEVVFNMPEKKMEVLDVRSNFFVVNGDEEKIQNMITENQRRKTFCTGNKLSEIFGLKLCGEVKYPNASMVDAAPYFPFTGPTTFSINLLKTDTHAGYKLLAKRLETKEQSIAQIAFDTPGSTVKRAIAVDFVLNFPNKELEVSTTSPWTEMTLKGNVINQEKQKAFKGSFVKDGEKYAINSIVDVNYEGIITKLSPRIEITRPNVKDIVLAGTVDIVGKKKFSTDLSLLGAISHPISIKGTIVDTAREKSFEGRLQFDKTGEYVLITSYKQDTNKQNTLLRVIPTFILKTPTEHIASIEGNLEKRAGRQVKGELTTTIKKLLPKTIKIKFNNVMRKDKKKNDRYDTDIFLSSKWITGKIDGNLVVSKNGGFTTRVSVDYNMPKVKKNKVTLSGKFTNKSTKYLHKYILKTTVDVKKNPEYNFVTSVDVSHNKRHSEATVNIKYGENMKDKTKHITLETEVNRKGTLAACSLDYKINADIPVYNVDMNVVGDHKHDRKSLVNNMNIIYGKKKIKSTLTLNDESGKMTRMSGDYSLTYPEHDFKLGTRLIQDKKQSYTHTVTMKLDDKKSTVTSSYKEKKGTHNINSEVFLHWFKPFVVSAYTSLDLDKLKAGAELERQKSKYGFELGKTSRDIYNHALNGKVYYPGREVTADVVGKVAGDRYTGRVESTWDAKDKSKKLSLEGNLNLNSPSDMDGSVKLVYPQRTIVINGNHQGNGRINSHLDVSWAPKQKIEMDVSHNQQLKGLAKHVKSQFLITTPFDNFSKIGADFGYDNNRNKIDTLTSVTWAKDKTVSVNLSVKKPLNVIQLDAEARVETPFKNYRVITADLSHRMTDKIRTEVNMKVDGKQIDTQLELTMKGDPHVEASVDGEFKVRSTMKEIPPITVTVKHYHGNDKYITDVIVNHDGKRYVYDIDAECKYSNGVYKNDGTLVLMSPGKKLSTSWNQYLDDKELKSIITADWGRNKRIHTDVSGSYHPETRKVEGKGTLKSPWKNLDASLEHECGNGFLKHSSILKEEGIVIGTANLNYRRTSRHINFGFDSSSPIITNNLSGSMTVSTKMPYTANGHFKWDHNKKVSIDGSFNGDLPVIEGTLRLTSPYNKLRSIYMMASNKKIDGEWVSTANFEHNSRKSIEVETKVGLDEHKKLRFSLLTPFHNLQKIDTGAEFSMGKQSLMGLADFEVVPHVNRISSSVSANWESGVTGKLRLDTPFRELPYAQVEVSSTDERKGRHSQIEIEYAPRQVIHLDTVYNLEFPIIFDVSLKSPFKHIEDIGANVRHHHNRRGVQTHVEVKYQPYKTIESDLKLKWQSGVDGSFTVKTPFDGYEMSKVSVNFNGVKENFKAGAEIEAKNKKVDADLSFNHGLNTAATFILHTPVPGFEEIKANLEKKGDIYDLDFTSYLKYKNDKEIKLDFENKASRGNLKTDFKLKLPYLLPVTFSIDHYGLLPVFRTKFSVALAKIAYLESDTNVNIRLPKIDIASDLGYRIYGNSKDMGIVIKKDGDWTDMQGRIEGHFAGRKASVIGNFKLDDRIVGGITISSPWLQNRDISVTFNHAGTRERFHTEAVARYLDKHFTGELNFFQDGLQHVTSDAKVTTPFDGYEEMSYGYKHQYTNQELTGNADIKYGYNKNINIDLSFEKSPVISGLLNIKFPVKKDDLTFNLNFNGQPDNLQADANLAMKGQKVFMCKMSHLKQSNRIKSTFQYKGLFMEDINASFEHNGIPFVNCRTNLDVSVGHHAINYDSEIIRDSDSIDIKLNGGAKRPNEHHKGSLLFKITGSLKEAQISLVGTLNGKEVSEIVNYRVSPNDLSINSLAKYIDGREMKLVADFEKNTWKWVTASGSLETPFEGYERNSMKYNHVLGDDSLTSKINVKYGKNKEILTVLEIESKRENKFDLEIKTPFSGYKAMNLIAKMNKNENTPSASVVLKLGRRNRYSIQGEMDITSSPITGSLNIATPFDAFDKADLKFTHAGEWKDFRTSAELKSKPTGVIEVENTFMYESPKSLDLSASWKSEFKNFEDISVVLKNSPAGQEGMSSLVSVEWSPEHKIELDGSFTKHQSWSSLEHSGTLTLTTPFDVIRSSSIRMSQNKEQDKYSEKVSATLNDKTLLEMDVDLKLGDKPEITINMDKPREIELTATGQTGHEIGGEIFVNWNKTDKISNLRLQGSVTPNGGRFDIDKEFNLKLIHPVRSMGINGNLQKSENILKSKGALLWNGHTGQHVGYEIDLSDTSRGYRNMMDAALKIEVPTRTVAFQGVINNTPGSKIVDGSVMWDADNDPTKKLGLKATVEPGKKTNKMDLTLSLPSINKDIRIGSEMTLDNGRVLFDGKTEFSYSPDSRKTLVLTSNVKDVSYGREHKNYTMSLGIRHSYTNTDVLVISHIGKSSDKLSTGMEMQYLTASRTKSNMMLLGEIDQLRRQINVDVISPNKRFQVVGEVQSLSPFHATIQNNIDNQPGVSAVLNVDLDKKTLDFKTNYDPNDLTNSFHVEGAYVNRTAIQANAYSKKQGRTAIDSLVFARLNTSRILHTRITWRPEIYRELQMYSDRTAAAALVKFNNVLKEGRAEVGKEVHYKYQSISISFEEEMKPMMDFVKRESEIIMKDLEIVIRELRRMRSRNDLYIRDMGDAIQKLYWKVYTELSEILKAYRLQYAEWQRSVLQQIEIMKNYPIREKYYETVYKMEALVGQWMMTVSQQLDKLVRTLKDKVNHHKAMIFFKFNNFKTSMINHPKVQALKQKIIELQNIDYNKYMLGFSDKIGKHIKDLNLREKYTSAVRNIHGVVKEHMNNFLQRHEVQYLHSLANDVYQEGKWAYNYWEVEENLKRHLQETYKLVKDLVKEEIELFIMKFNIIPRIYLTYYNPKQGELQADIYLPVPMHTLDSPPEDIYTQAYQDIKYFIDRYIPTEKVQNYFNSTSNDDEDDFKKELREYMNSPTVRKVDVGRRRMRRLRQ